MLYAEILAGGSGTRMGNTDLPKQFMVLGTKPIIIHTIEQFVIEPRFSKIIVCCPKMWITYMQDLMDKYLPGVNNVVIVEGGATRNDSIVNGCKYILENYGVKDDDIIVTHDAVRPFVTHRIIEDNIAAGLENDAVDTVIAATDTIVESKDGEYLSSIPNRRIMYQGQTPQTFKIKQFLDIYEKMTDEEKNILTDGCKAFVMKEKKVKIVRGEDFNMKITTMHDYKMCNAILLERNKQ